VIIELLVLTSGSQYFYHYYYYYYFAHSHKAAGIKIEAEQMRNGCNSDFIR